MQWNGGYLGFRIFNDGNDQIHSSPIQLIDIGKKVVTCHESIKYVKIETNNTDAWKGSFRLFHPDGTIIPSICSGCERRDLGSSEILIASTSNKKTPNKCMADCRIIKK